MKPVKPCKAWAVAIGDGGLLNQLYHAKSQCPFVLRAVRVRIIEDAAVERAITAIRRVMGQGIEGTADCVAAIRDLGGRP